MREVTCLERKKTDFEISFCSIVRRGESLYNTAFGGSALLNKMMETKWEKNEKGLCYLVRQGKNPGRKKCTQKDVKCRIYFSTLEYPARPVCSGFYNNTSIVHGPKT